MERYKPVSVCGRNLSHRAARILTVMADHKGVMHTNSPEQDWVLITEEHLRVLAERMSYSDLRGYRGVGELLASELEHFFSEFGISLRSTQLSEMKPRWLPKPRWKQQLPTTPGWYWWRYHPCSEPKLYCVREGGRLPVSGWWFGPLKPPRFDGFQPTLHDLVQRSLPSTPSESQEISLQRRKVQMS